jgi:hypothetical protein
LQTRALRNVDTALLSMYPTVQLSPLLLACRYGHVELVRLLLEHHADPNYLSPVDVVTHTTPGHAAAAIAELLRAHGARGYEAKRPRQPDKEAGDAEAPEPRGKRGRTLTD